MNQRRMNDERGATLVLAAVGLVVAVIMAGLAIDVGFIAQEARDNQKVADLAAMDAVRVLPADPTIAARESALRNGFRQTTPPHFIVEAGTLAAGVFTVTAPAAASAVRVKAMSVHDNQFPFNADGQQVSRIAVASKAPGEAAFSVGSTLASLDTQQSALDAVLGGWLGLTAAQMSLVGYDGLATGNVSLAALQTKLLAINSSYDIGTPDKLLATEVKVGDLLKAASQVLADQGNTTAAAQLNNIPIATLASSLRVKLGSLVSLSSPSSDSALDTTLNVFNLVSGSAQVASRNGFVYVPGINILVPGIANVTTALSVIQPAQMARGPVGAVAKNSQVVLRLHLAFVPALGTGSLDIDFRGASAQATLTNIDCDATPGISLNAETAGATVGGSGNVVGALPSLGGTLAVTGALADTTGTEPLMFDYPTEFVPPVGPPPPPHKFEHVGVANLNLNPATVTVTATGGLTAQTVAATLNLSMGLVLSTVTPVLQTALQPLLRALGLDLAAADVTAIGIYEPPPACDIPALVQ